VRGLSSGGKPLSISSLHPAWPNIRFLSAFHHWEKLTGFL
jgi:hypothetical protein